MKCPGCQHENRPTARFCEDCGNPLNGASPTTGSYAQLKTEVESLRRVLTESLEQQTATAEVLRTISASPTELQPVFEVVVKSAVRFCGADDAIILRLDGENLWAAAHNGPIPVDFGLSVPCVRGTVGGRSVLERRAVHVTDLQAEAEEFPEGSAFAKRFGARTTLGVPLLREGAAIGTIQLRRSEVDPFTDKQIDLLKTFADQAVIAIENVRLFKELEARNRDLIEALERQTATSEILRVISSFQTDVQPVFDAIAAKALELCRATTGWVYRFDGELINIAAAHSLRPEAVEVVRQSYPMPPSRGGASARAVLSRSIIYIPDIREDHEYRLEALAKAADYSSVLAVPMLLEGKPIGVITVTGAEARAFSQRQIELLQTFADQAVIAIENVRLFNETKEALERQTATSDILRVISSSLTDTQPVFDAIAANAARLCAARDAQVLRVEGDVLRLVSACGSPSMPPVRSISRGHAVGRAVIDRQTIHVRDMAQAVAEFPETSAPLHGVQSVLAVPLLRKDVAIGVIRISRTQIQPFTDAQVALLQTFADQAVIAIENVQLFTELRARNQELTVALAQQTATSEVLAVISGAQTDVQPVFEAIAQSARRLCDASYSSVYRLDGQLVHLVAHNHHTPEAAEAIRDAWPMLLTADSFVVRAIRENTVIHTDMQEDSAASAPLIARAKALAHRRVLVVPMVREGQPIGALRVSRGEATPFADQHIALLNTFADQAVIGIENVRLFNELQARNSEIEDKSRQLEVASQHKSEFLANMSHELRTPLNAVIGFSEVLTERMFGELNEKQDEYVRDIYASGTHLLSLINDILDLSKVEAGRMELELADFHLPQAIENALVLVRERALRRGITLEQSIDPDLGEIQGDERKVKQVLLNLLSNAIKFTPEGGKIEVRAVLRDEVIEVSASDTGVGIAPEDQEAIFEEFRQVGTAARKVEGTGLGLALSRKFIELHGGRIWVESQIGAGSTFTFTIPVRRGE
jgi:two-component system NtrC family sensor kinase